MLCRMAYQKRTIRVGQPIVRGIVARGHRLRRQQLTDMLIQQNDRPRAGSARQFLGELGIVSVRSAAYGEESVGARAPL